MKQHSQQQGDQFYLSAFYAKLTKQQQQKERNKHFYNAINQEIQGKSIQFAKSHEETFLGFFEVMRELGCHLHFLVI